MYTDTYTERERRNVVCYINMTHDKTVYFSMLTVNLFIGHLCFANENLDH